MYGKQVSVHNYRRKCTEVHETHSVWFVLCSVEILLKRYGAAKGIVYGKHMSVHNDRRKCTEVHENPIVCGSCYAALK